MPKEVAAGKRQEFVWTDDESELLLSVTLQYKVQRTTEGIDWESVRSKYEDILVLFREALPDTPEEACGKDYPHERDAVSKLILSTKLKNIRIKYRQAVDSGRRSGNGRVVMLYFELCQQIWGGSPATEQLDGGMESEDLVESQPEPQQQPGPSPLTTQPEDELSGAQLPAEEAETSPPSRRALLDKTLKNYKQEKMKRKLPADAQLLHCAQEELEMKRRLVDRMEHMDKVYSENMKCLSSNMEKLTNSISQGFAMLQSLVGQQTPYHYPPPPGPPPLPQAQSSYPFNPYLLRASSPSPSYSSHDSPYPDSELHD